MVILGLDPGIATVGFGVIRTERGRSQALSFGAITTPATTPLSERLDTIFQDCAALIEASVGFASSIASISSSNSSMSSLLSRACSRSSFNISLNTLVIFLSLPISSNTSGFFTDLIIFP